MTDHLRITYGKCELNPQIIVHAKVEEEARKAKDGTNSMECKLANVVGDDGNTTIV